MKTVKPVFFLAILGALVAGMIWSGLIPISMGTSSIVAQWENEFSAKARTDQDGVSHLTIRSGEFGDAQCGELLEFKGLRYLDLAGSGITDAGLKQIARLESLQSLNLDRTQVTSAGLSSLSSAKLLKELSLVSCELGASYDGLSSLENIETLNLNESDASDSSVAPLASLGKLRNLYLARTDVTSACLKHFAELQKLKLLNVAGVKLSKESDFAALGTLPALELLYLDYAGVNNSALEALANSCVENKSQLTALFLEGCEDVTDDAMDSLASISKLPGLVKMRLTGTKLSRGIYDQLVAMAPDVSFAYGSVGGSED